MGAFQRLRDIIRAKVNKLLDRAEDPRDTLDLSYEKQLENLQKLRRSVAEVATARKRIEMQAAQLQAQGAKLQDQARQALGQGNEDLAREALSRRSAIAGELSELETQHSQIAAQQEKLTETAQRIQGQVEAFRTRKETMKASYTAAEAQSKIGEAAAGINSSMSDAGMALQRAQDKVADMQARAGAIDELLESGALTDLTSNSDDIQAQLDKMASTSQVDRELAQLKAELGTGAAAELGASEPSPDAEAATDAEAVTDAETVGDPGSGADTQAAQTTPSTHDSTSQR